MQINISGRNVELSRSTKDKVERHLRFGLTRFSPSIRDANCIISDESGPKGAATRRCLIVVRFRGAGKVTVDAEADSIVSAASLAANRAERAVNRYIARKRQTTRYRRRRETLGIAPSAI